MPDLTYAPRPLAALPAAVREPSYAAQILTVTAWVLEQDPARAVTETGLHRALQTAAATIVGTLPAVVAETATLRARAELPPYTGTSRGEYALRLRAAAKGI
ncbi:hypothetical protein [Streptomyces sp. NBC_00620]|uniref:hypothetical protein n=1 Tax=Streptomyces sp. NBC_00620 TaxID=2903666 RepID=UPI0022587EDA|nr:hypothetical protein [Streptomyces sp. NBC_00620]MCX4974249.1 hypothetical protein [Streptomyces sp. NBC_00620]